MGSWHIKPAPSHIAAACRHPAVARRPHLEARRHLEDEPIPDQHISLELAVSIDHGAALQARPGRRRVLPRASGGWAGRAAAALVSDAALAAETGWQSCLALIRTSSPRAPAAARSSRAQAPTQLERREAMGPLSALLHDRGTLSNCSTAPEGRHIKASGEPGQPLFMQNPCLHRQPAIGPHRTTYHRQATEPDRDIDGLPRNTRSAASGPAALLPSIQLRTVCRCHAHMPAAASWSPHLPPPPPLVDLLPSSAGQPRPDVVLSW